MNGSLRLRQASGFNRQGNILIVVPLPLAPTAPTPVLSASGVLVAAGFAPPLSDQKLCGIQLDGTCS